MIKQYFPVSVIIPVYNDLEGLKNTLSSLNLQTFDHDLFEIIVVVDGKNKSVTKFCEDLKITSFSTGNKVGAYAARNLGIKKSKGIYLAFIDAGSIAHKDWLRNAVLLANKYDYLGGPVILNGSNSSLGIYQKSVLFQVSEYLSTLHFSPTTNLFVKQKVIQDLGDFDSSLPSSGDYEFGDRVFFSGKFKQYYSPTLKVYHPQRSIKSLLAKQKRLALGFYCLGKKYPKRFPKANEGILKLMIKLVVPPLWLLNKKRFIALSSLERVQVFLWAYYFAVNQNLWRIYFALFKPHAPIHEQ